MSKIFSKIGLNWIETNRDFFVNSLSQRRVGKSIAVLKTLIAIALNSDFHSRLAKISYSELEEVTGLSRPMISYSIELLITNGLIERQKPGKGKMNSYLLKDGNDKSWSKIPNLTLEASLKKLSNRNKSTLGALKIFLVLAKFRDGKINATQISHQKIIEKTGLQPTQISICNDILISNGLIEYGRVLQENGFLTPNNNIYVINKIEGNRKNEILNNKDIKSIFIQDNK